MNMFERFYKSLYSTKDMAKYRFLSFGKAILHSFLLILLTTIVTMTTTILWVNSALNDGKMFLQEDIPSFTIEDGQLKTDVAEPIKTERGGIRYLFDASGKTKAEQISPNDNSIAVLQDEIVFSFAPQQNKLTYNELHTLLGDTITKKSLLDGFTTITSFKWIVFAIGFVLVFLIQTLFVFIAVSVLALFGTMFAAMQQRALDYRRSWMLSAYALTISTVFSAVMLALSAQVPFEFAVTWIVNFVIMGLIIREIPPRKQQEEA